MDLGNRIELFRCLVGSHNYNLNDETSDKDYKVFITPNFDDLYYNKQFSKSYIGETEDLDIHDIRKCSNLWWKANVNFLEVLYSNEIIINPKLSRYTKGKIQDIFSIKEDIVKMNLPYLYNACIGMHLTKKKQIDKGTQSTQQLVDKYGYDTKQALHAIRILEFLMRFADNGFKDFKSAIRYEDYDLYKTRLISIKNGKFSKELFEQLAYDMFCEVEGKYKDIYYNQNVNQHTKNYLDKIIKTIVTEECFR